MAESDQDLDGLLANPRESLDLEFKQWIDPSSAEGKAKIARACIALRNNNGGRLLIGYKNDGTPDVGNAPADVATVFHPDVVQGIVSKYSSEVFAVEVSLGERDGQNYPVISVPAGVRTPVAAKSDLRAPDGNILVKDHAVYVRSLTANNTVSSAEAKRKDWENLTRICFDNREADIGGFVRRHLATLNLEALASLVPAFAQMLHRPSNAERLLAALNNGRERLNMACASRKLTIPDIGFRESAIIVEGEVPVQSPDIDFRNRLLRNAPSLTGWTPFLDFSSGGRRPDHPYVLDNGWQALIASLPPEPPIMGHHFDFWRIEPNGQFFHIRGYEDDLNESRGMAPRQQLDFLLQIARTAEVMATGLSFARSLGCKEDATTVLFGFRWTRLHQRILSCWVEPRRFFRSVSVSQQDEYVSAPIIVPLETPPTGIAPHVENAVKGLFNLFDGTQIPSQVIADIVDDTVLRRR